MDDNLERLGIPFVGSWVEKQTQDSALDGIEVREGGVEPEQQRGGCRACPRHHPRRRGGRRAASTSCICRQAPHLLNRMCVFVFVTPLTLDCLDFLRQKLRGDLHLNGDVLT